MPRSNAVKWFYEGINFDNIGAYNEAVESYNRAIEEDPQYTVAYYNKGVSLISLNRFEAALKVFDQALGIDPRYEKAWFQKGIALSKLGRHEDAAKCYDEAVRLNPQLASMIENENIPEVSVSETRAASDTARNIASRMRPERLAACPYCGTEVQFPGALFCMNCGASLQEEQLELSQPREQFPKGAQRSTAGRQPARVEQPVIVIRERKAGKRARAAVPAKEEKISVTDRKCIVCNLNFKLGDPILRCPHCGNIAHKVHLLEWLHVKDRCPVCSQRIDDNELTKQKLRAQA
ncbi:MAG: tetratricopeptide repeat protein [Candidatus Atabeyarchaeum deiterrae]